jgi:putative endonuclease
LYVGITNDLPRRIAEHKTGRYTTSFTARYTFDRCVYFEFTDSQKNAARRERQLKAWSRSKKVALIQDKNPNWIDLSTTWARALMTT